MCKKCLQKTKELRKTENLLKEVKESLNFVVRSSLNSFNLF